MTAQELEEKVWLVDRIRVVVRTESAKEVGDYSFKNGAQANWSVTEFLEKRLSPVLEGAEAVVVMGNGEQPHGRTLIDSVRNSYQGR